MTGHRLGLTLRPWRKAVDVDSSPDELASVGRKKRKKMLNGLVVVLKETLFALRDSSDACPPLKSTVGALAHIVNNLEVMFLYNICCCTYAENGKQRMNGNKEEALRIVQRIDNLLDLLESLIPDCTEIPKMLLIAIAGLDKCVVLL